MLGRANINRLKWERGLITCLLIARMIPDLFDPAPVNETMLTVQSVEAMQCDPLIIDQSFTLRSSALHSS